MAGMASEKKKKPLITQPYEFEVTLFDEFACRLKAGSADCPMAVLDQLHKDAHAELEALTEQLHRTIQDCVASLTRGVN